MSPKELLRFTFGDQLKETQSGPVLMPYTERDDEPTWRDVQLPPLRESPSYVYQGDSETEDTVYLVGPAGELNPSDELCAAVEAVLAKVIIATDNAYDSPTLDDVQTDLENALERYRGRQ